MSHKFFTSSDCHTRYLQIFDFKVKNIENVGLETDNTKSFLSPQIVLCVLVWVCNTKEADVHRPEVEENPFSGFKMVTLNFKN